MAFDTLDKCLGLLGLAGPVYRQIPQTNTPNSLEGGLLLVGTYPFSTAPEPPADTFQTSLMPIIVRGRSQRIAGQRAARRGR